MRTASVILVLMSDGDSRDPVTTQHSRRNARFGTIQHQFEKFFDRSTPSIPCVSGPEFFYVYILPFIHVLIPGRVPLGERVTAAPIYLVIASLQC